MRRDNLFLFVYALGKGVYINLVGRLLLAEAFALITLPFIDLRKLLNKNALLRLVLGGLFIVLISQIISDLINNSEPSDYLRGWALVVFSMISTIFLVEHLSKNSRGVLFYFAALFLIRLLFAEVDLDLSVWQENTNIFKIRFVGFLNPAILLFGYYLHNNKAERSTVLLFLSYGLLCISFDARSNGLIHFISALLLFVKTTDIKLSFSRVSVLSVFLVLIMYLGYIIYVNQVLYHEFGGSNARRQLGMVSNPYNPFLLLYYGRFDVVVLIHAISDNAIWGYGSWGRDPNGYYAKLVNIVMGFRNSHEGAGYIRAHSILLGVWAYAGILGFAAIGVVFYKLFLASFRIIKSAKSNPILPIIVILTVGMMWHMLFSPIGLLRTFFPLFSALVIVEHQKYINLRKLTKSIS